MQAHRGRAAPTPAAGLELQSFLDVEAMHLLVVNAEPVAPQQDVRPPGTVRDPRGRQLMQPPSNRRAVRPHRAIPHQPPRGVEDPTGPALADAEGVLRPAYRRASLCWAHHTLPSDTRRKCLSSVRSATTCFSFRFSSRSCLSSTTSLTSSPVNRFFHR